MTRTIAHSMQAAPTLPTRVMLFERPTLSHACGLNRLSNALSVGLDRRLA